MSTNPFDDIESEGSYIPIHILIQEFLPIIRSIPRNNIRYTLQTFYLAISKHPDLTLDWIDIICNDFKKSSFPGEYRLLSDLAMSIVTKQSLLSHWLLRVGSTCLSLLQHSVY